MEMFCFGLMGGMILAVIFIAGGAVYANRDIKRTNDVDSDIRVYVPSRDRDRSGNQRNDTPMEERAMNVLEVFRIGACRYETEVIDWLEERLESEFGYNPWQE